MDRHVSTWGNEFFPFNPNIEYEVGAIVFENNRLFVASRFVEENETFTEGDNFHLFDAYENLKLFDEHQDVRGYRTLYVHDGHLTHDANIIPRSVLDGLISDLHDARVAADGDLVTSLSARISEVDVSGIYDFSGMFSGYANPVNVSEIDFSTWNVSRGKTFRSMFEGAILDTNRTMAAWNLRSATDVSRMFMNADLTLAAGNIEFTNLRPILANDMFRGCTNIVALINQYDMSRATNVSGMFFGADFTIGVQDNDFTTWTLENCTNVDEFIQVSTRANPVDQAIAQLDTRSLTRMPVDFFTFNNGDPVNWGAGGEPVFGRHTEEMTKEELQKYIDRYQTDETNEVYRNTLIHALTSTITDMSNLGFSATFNVDISAWDTSAVTVMDGMFKGATAFNQAIPFDTSSVTTMTGMFEDCTAFNQDISGWDVSNVTKMNFMFSDCTAFDQPVGTWGASTSAVTTMEGMFMNATSFNQDLALWDVSNVTNMDDMFNGATSFNGGN